MGCEMIGYNKEVIYDIRADDNKIARKPHKMWNFTIIIA